MTAPPRQYGNLFTQVRTLAFLAWRNLWRNRVRSLLTLAAMVVGLTFMVLTAALNEGMMRKFIAYATDIQMGHIQVHHALYKKDRDLYATLPPALLEHLERETGLRGTPRAYASALASAADQSTGVLLKAVDPLREGRVTQIGGHVRRGGWRLDRWQPPGGQATDGPPVYWVMIGNRVAKTLDVTVGSEIVLITQAADGSIGNGLFRVAGILRPIEPAFDRAGVLMSMEAYQSLMFLPAGVHEFAFRSPDVTQAPRFREQLVAALQSWQGGGVEGGREQVLVRDWTLLNPSLYQIIDWSSVSLGIIMAIIFGVAGLGMMNTVMMAIHERQREFGMLLAMGMGRMRLLGMVLTESLLLVALGGLAGTLGGVGFSLWLERVGIDFSRWMPNGIEWSGVTMEPSYKTFLLPGHLTMPLVMMTVIVMLAALVPAWRAIRFQPAEVMHR